jgi:tripartite-type tricarboxylate transporter receptor subunit TctC
MVIENRPGASGAIAAQTVVRAEPDGCTLLYGVFSHAVAPALVHLSYDTLKDLTAVVQTASVPLFMFAGAKTPYRRVADVIAAAKAAPATLTFASGGVGSSAHLAGELFARRAGIKLVHVPFRGGAPATQSLLAGEVDLLWDTPQPGTRSYLQEQQIRALAVMSRARLAAYPDIPAIAEAGLGGNLEVQAWQGILVRTGTPPEVIERLYRAVASTMAVTEARERIEALAVEPMATPPAAFNSFFRAEVARWTTIAREAGISAQ